MMTSYFRWKEFSISPSVEMFDFACRLLDIMEFMELDAAIPTMAN